MTEQELAEIERKLTHVATALYEGDSHAVNVLELSRLAGDLFGEVRRLQGQLEEGRGQAALLLGLAKSNPCHVYMGACPDDSQPTKRDGRCPACKMLVQAEKVVKSWDKKGEDNAT